MPIIDFNPWMFSGAQQLVEIFFIELAAQLKIRPGLAEVAKDLENYGSMFSGMVWLPFIGPWIERGRGLTKILNKYLKHRKKGVGEHRAMLEKALADLNKPIIIILDDIDRLSTPEIRDVFKLVRLTANFPNIIYILAFDRGRIEIALSENGILGRDYLEKILQLAIDLPIIPKDVLNRQILMALDDVLADINNPGNFDEQVWADVFTEIIRPLIRNMRDVRRYATAVHLTLESIEGQVALVDVLALEAVRVFLPNISDRLHGAVDGLTSTSGHSSGVRHESPHLKKQIDDLLEIAEKHDDIVKAMIERLFPAGLRHIGGSHYGESWKGRWLRERRVAHEDVFRLYLERITGEGLQAFNYAEQAWSRMADYGALKSYFDSLNRECLQDVITALEVYEDKFKPEHVVPGTIVLLNLLPDIPIRKGGMFELGVPIIVTRVTYRLLRSLDNPSEVEAAVRLILPELNTLSAKLELISDIGHREGRGHKLVSENAARELEKAWRDEVRVACIDDLTKEIELVRIFLALKRETEASEPTHIIDEAPNLTVAILESALSETKSQSMGSHAIRRTSRLAWDALIEIYENEETLKNRIEDLKDNNIKGVDGLLELVDKYLGGWRPGDFGED